VKAVAPGKPRKRCAVYCRVSSDERLDQDFNSIDAQKEAGRAYIVSQVAEGWIPVADDYDDPGFSGGHLERPSASACRSSGRCSARSWDASSRRVTWQSETEGC
jgi:hypothetical protein